MKRRWHRQVVARFPASLGSVKQSKFLFVWNKASKMAILCELCNCTTVACETWGVVPLVGITAHSVMGAVNFMPLGVVLPWMRFVGQPYLVVHQ